MRSGGEEIVGCGSLQSGGWSCFQRSRRAAVAVRQRVRPRIRRGSGRRRSGRRTAPADRSARRAARPDDPAPPAVSRGRRQPDGELEGSAARLWVRGPDGRRASRPAGRVVRVCRRVRRRPDAVEEPHRLRRADGARPGRADDGGPCITGRTKPTPSRSRSSRCSRAACILRTSRLRRTSRPGRSGRRRRSRIRAPAAARTA
jgi:hypothetical protein